MNKSELIDKIAESSGLSKSDVDAVMSSMFEVVTAHVGSSDDKIQLPGFMTIQSTQRAARTGRNPRTGESIQIPASRGVKVSAGSKLKAAAKGS